MKTLIIAVLILISIGLCGTNKTPNFNYSSRVLAIAPTKMNVFYIGVDNPVNIALSGISSRNIFPVIVNLGDTIFKKGNEYIVRVTKPGTVNIAVHAIINGKRRVMGVVPFRVKRVPDPVAKLGNYKGGNITKTSLLAQSNVIADLENFDFDLRFNVVSYVVSTIINGFEISIVCQGSNLTEEAKNILRRVKRGGKVYFEDIKALGPDGTVRNLGSMVFKII